VPEYNITIGLGLPVLPVLGQEELPGLLVVTVVHRQGTGSAPVAATSQPRFTSIIPSGSRTALWDQGEFS